MDNTRRVYFIAMLVVVALLLWGCGDATPATAANHSTATPASQATQHAPTAIAKITAAQKQQVSDILSKNIQHYQQLMAAGKQVLGTTQYADANAGLAAFNDPNSAASKFRDWRQSSNAERDLSYLDAFTQADKNYTADNEPTAISTWRDDMSTMQVDLSAWVTTAVSWQIRDKTDADLNAAQATFEQDIKQVQSDLAATLAAS